MPRAQAKTSKEWSDEIVDLLERLRRNSVSLSEYHRKRFYYYKGFSKYFDMPILVMSVISSSFAVGTQGYIDQKLISATSCLISVIVSIITSVKLYLNIESSMQNELKMSREFYSLSIDIFRALTLNPKDRGEMGMTYLQKVFGVYVKLVESSHLLTQRFKGDMLTPPGFATMGEADEDIFSIGKTPKRLPSLARTGLKSFHRNIEYLKIQRMPSRTNIDLSDVTSSSDDDHEILGPPTARESTGGLDGNSDETKLSSSSSVRKSSSVRVTSPVPSTRSTHSSAVKTSSSEAVREGISVDGGMIPERLEGGAVTLDEANIDDLAA